MCKIDSQWELAVQDREISLVLCDDLDGWHGWGVGGTSKREEIYLYIQLIHFVVQQKLTKHCKATILQFKKKNYLAIWGLFWFHSNFRIICYSPMKNAIGILIEIILNLQIALGSMDILILILPIHDHGLSFHLFVSFSVSFHKVLQPLEYRFENCTPF